MAKTTTRKIADAESILHKLTAAKADLATARANDESEMAAVSYAAHTGDQRAAAKLEALRDRAIKRDIEARNLDSAIAEAQRRVDAAKDAAERAEQARVAAEIEELAGLLRESGARADKGLRLMIQGSNEMARIIAAMQERGLGNPSQQQLQSLGRRAVLAGLVDSPFNREFEHLAPRDRQDFAKFSSSWADAIERAVRAKTKQEENAL